MVESVKYLVIAEDFCITQIVENIFCFLHRRQNVNPGYFDCSATFRQCLCGTGLVCLSVLSRIREFSRGGGIMKRLLPDVFHKLVNV